MAIVHDLVSNVDGRRFLLESASSVLSVALEGELDDFDRAVDPRTKTPGIGEQNTHHATDSSVLSEILERP